MAESKKNLLVIGAGQLGSRHLQALKTLPYACQITVVDPSAQSLKVAEARYNEVQTEVSHEAKFLETLPTQKQNYDFAILACSAKPRRQALEKLLKEHSVSNLLLEKILYDRHQDYIDMASLIKCPT
jgi:siroheme synthase (precorrin-2 oxidase/ferrochelatase)